MKYRCQLCPFVYDPAFGDPELDIPENTPFEDLPEDWICPECGADKSEFKPIDI